MDDDTIYRQAAIDAAELLIKDLRKDTVDIMNFGHNYNHGVADAIATLKHLPSAERRGRWIRTGEDGYCSVCKCDMPMFRNDWEWEYTETPHCPNCGARMEVE